MTRVTAFINTERKVASLVFCLDTHVTHGRLARHKRGALEHTSPTTRSLTVRRPLKLFSDRRYVNQAHAYVRLALVFFSQPYSQGHQVAHNFGQGPIAAI